MDIILNLFVTLLTFLYRIFANDMVLSIAVFTILVRLLTLPLTISQQRSTRAMQKLQPELKKLQEKYKMDIVLHERDGRVQVQPARDVLVESGDTVIVFARHTQVMDMSAKSRRAR